MVKSNSKKEEEKERRFSQEQYEILKRCSQRQDMTEWNNWRKRSPQEEIWLEGVLLQKAYLKGAELDKAHLEGANFAGSNLENIHLNKAYLQNANLSNANLKGPSDLSYAHMENANLSIAHLEKVYLLFTHLEGANLHFAHLEGAILQGTYLQRAMLFKAHLEGADLTGGDLKGASFLMAVVNEVTLIWECEVDRKTEFRGVALDSARIDPGTKQILEYNIRRMNWEEWYRGKSDKKWRKITRQLVTCPIRWFWWMSNYGRSTLRIILTFFILAIVFAVIYWLWPSCVMVNWVVGDIRGFVHALYFSVVTMTTLGFGDIAANPDSWGGQVLLMVQVILGYALLGALVTRFAILFTTGGPGERSRIIRKAIVKEIPGQRKG